MMKEYSRYILPAVAASVGCYSAFFSPEWAVILGVTFLYVIGAAIAHRTSPGPLLPLFLGEVLVISLGGIWPAVVAVQIVILLSYLFSSEEGEMKTKETSGMIIATLSVPVFTAAFIAGGAGVLPVFIAFCALCAAAAAGAIFYDYSLQKRYRGHT